MKTLVFLGIIALAIWLIKITRSNKSKKSSKDCMVECKVCKTFVLQDESIYLDRHYFCSKECLKKAIQ